MASVQEQHSKSEALGLYVLIYVFFFPFLFGLCLLVYKLMIGEWAICFFRYFQGAHRALLPDISAAVLKLSESGRLHDLESSLLSSYKCSASEFNNDDCSTLGLDSFWGLFAITAGVSTIALLLFQYPRAFPKWPFSSRVHIDTEQQQQQRQQNVMQNLLHTEVEQQHNQQEDENFLFEAEIKNQRYLLN